MPAPLDPACIFAVLAEHHVDYVLIGGLAAVLHGSTAMTNDADIVPSRADDNGERLSAAGKGREARLRLHRGNALRAQDALEASWTWVRPQVVDIDAQAVALVDDFVSGRRSVPCELRAGDRYRAVPSLAEPPPDWVGPSQSAKTASWIG